MLNFVKTFNQITIGTLLVLACGAALSQDAPALDVSKGIGPDVNHDYIRDDIPYYIYSLNVDDYKAMLLLTYHKAMYKTMWDGLKNLQLAKDNVAEVSNAVACIKENFLYPQQNLDYVKKLTLNTKERLDYYNDLTREFPENPVKCNPYTFTDKDWAPLKPKAVVIKKHY